MILLSLPVPPSINKARRVARGRIVNTLEAQDWKALAGREARRQAPTGLRGPVLLVINVERGANVPGAREDVDNRIKLLQDVLVDAKIIEDDSLVAGLAVAWAPPGTRTARIAVLPMSALSLRFHPANTTAAAGGWIIPAAIQEEEAA